MKASSRQFLIRGAPREQPSEQQARKEEGHLSEYRKRVRESRYESSMVHSEFADNNTKRKMLKLEETIFALQDRSISLAESIEFEARAEDFYDREIAALKKTLGELREKKLSYIRQPRDLRTDLAELEQKSKSLKDNVDEMRSKNRLLREKIDSLRKERSVFDGIYTKLERDIHLKERTLKRLIEAEDQRKESTKATETKLSSIQNHYSKDNQRLGNEFSTVVNKLSCLGNSSAMNESDMHGLESMSFDRQVTQTNDQKGLASLRFNNSVAARFDSGREEELRQLSSKVARLKLICQEDDLDYLQTMYEAGEEINHGLYSDSLALDAKIDIYTQETEELNAHVELLERGLDSESQLQYQRILELRPELEQLCKQSAGLETKCNHQRHQNENLEVDWADEVPVGDTV